jgi:DNA-binding transcriptional regulator YbjK
MIPSVIDNQQHFLADSLNELMDRCRGGPLDIATAYFAISGYKLVRERLRGMDVQAVGVVRA